MHEHSKEYWDKRVLKYEGQGIASTSPLLETPQHLQKILQELGLKEQDLLEKRARATADVRDAIDNISIIRNKLDWLPGHKGSKDYKTIAAKLQAEIDTIWKTKTLRKADSTDYLQQINAVRREIKTVNNKLIEVEQRMLRQKRWGNND